MLWMKKAFDLMPRRFASNAEAFFKNVSVS